MKKTIASLLLIMIAGMFFSPTALVLAQEEDGTTVLENPLNIDSIEDLIQNIVDWIFKIALIVAPLMIIIGAFIFLTSGGNMEKVTQGKNIIKWSVIGLAIIVGSKAIIALIKNIIGA